MHQDNVPDNSHTFEVEPTHKNPLVQKMLRRLAKAASIEKIQRQMDAEDSLDRMITRELQEKDDKIIELEDEIKDLKRALEEMRNNNNNKAS